LITLSLVAAAVAVVQGPAAQDWWRYLLLRTLGDEEGLANATLYVGDLTNRTLEAVATFEPGFIISDAVPNSTWEYLLVAGYPYDTAEEITRVYKVALGPHGERETIFEDRRRRRDSIGILPAPEEGVFFLTRHFSVLTGDEAKPQTQTILYRYAPGTEIEELADIEGNVGFCGVAGEGKFYVEYDEWRLEGRTVVFGYYDLATGELTASGFEPPDRHWNPGMWPPARPVYGEGPLSYSLGVVKCGSSYGIDFYFREPDDPEDYRNVKVEATTAGFFLCRDRDVIVYIPELDVEENGLRIVTKYLDTTYGEPFPLPTDPARPDLQEQRREYEMLYVE
jgi:hypothetical protein